MPNATFLVIFKHCACNVIVLNTFFAIFAWNWFYTLQLVQFGLHETQGFFQALDSLLALASFTPIFIVRQNFHGIFIIHFIIINKVQTFLVIATFIDEVQPWISLVLESMLWFCGILDCTRTHSLNCFSEYFRLLKSKYAVKDTVARRLQNFFHSA